MTRKSLCSRLKSGLEHSCWTGSPPVCERLRATKADLFRAGLQVQRASDVNRRAKRPGQINNTPVRNVDHFRSYFRKQLRSLYSWTSYNIASTFDKLYCKCNRI